jgi:hypothetical protein
LHELVELVTHLAFYGRLAGGELGDPHLRKAFEETGP